MKKKKEEEEVGETYLKETTSQPCTVACLHILDPGCSSTINEMIFNMAGKSYDLPRKPLPPATTMRFAAMRLFQVSFN